MSCAKYVFCFAVPFLVGCNSLVHRFDEKSRADRSAAHAGIPTPPTYEEIATVTLHDPDTREARRVLCAVWGSPANQDGVLGLFDIKGRIIFSERIPGLLGIDRVVSIYCQNDSVLLTVLYAYGTGYRVETKFVLTLANGMLRRVFECEGLAYSEHGSIYSQDVRLIFVDTDDDGTSEIIRMVEKKTFASRRNMEAEEPNDSIKKAEGYCLDTDMAVFVRVFD